MTKHKPKSYRGKGGAVGTAGNVGTLVDNMFALVKSIVDTIVNTTEFVVDVVELPGNMGKAFREPAAPGTELV